MRRTAAAVAVIAVLAGGCAATPSRSDRYVFTTVTTAPGLIPSSRRKPVETYAGRTLSGARFSLAAVRGHVTVLNWFAQWCDSCRVETPQFALLYPTEHRAGVDFVGFDIHDDAPAARSFVAANHIDYPIVFDELGRSLLQLGNIAAPGPPFTLLLDRHFRVAAVYFGPVSDATLHAALDRLLAER